MIHELFDKLHHLDQLIAWAGIVGLTLIVFCETGLLVGFFLPGDSLLVMAGFIASQGTLDFWTLGCWLSVAAILGDSTGYAIGHYVGPKIFKKNDSFFFKKDHLERTHQFFEKHGSKTIVLARFVPIVRTFAPTVAGVGRMPYRQFVIFNILGGLFWVWGMTGVGYFLGNSVPGIEKKIHWVILGVIAVSFLPVVIEGWNAWKKSKIVR